MFNQKKWILPTIFLIVIAGVVVVLAVVNKKSDQETITVAIDRLFSAEAIIGGLSIDTFLDPNKIMPDLSEGLPSLPFRLSGPIEVKAVNQRNGLIGQTKLDFIFGGSGDSLFTAEIKTIGSGKNYLFLQGLPTGGSDEPDLTSLNNVWFELGESEVFLMLPKINEKIVIPGKDTVTNLDSDLNRPWLTPVARLADTVVDGKPVMHYELKVDSTGLVNFLTTILAGLTGRELTVEQKANIEQWINKSDLIAEGYIDRRSENFRAIKFGFFPKAGQVGQPLAVTLKIDQLSGPVTVVAPDNSQPLSSSLIRLLSRELNN